MMVCKHCKEQPEAIEINLSKKFKYMVVLGRMLCFANDHMVITKGVDINRCPMCGRDLKSGDDK